MPLDQTLLTDDAPTGDTKPAGDTAPAGDTKPAGDAAAAVSVDDQRKFLVEKGGKADELAKLSEADLKKAYEDAKTKDTAAAAEGAPKDGKYEFKAPEGVQLDADLTKEFTGLAVELNLSQAKAQKVVDLGAKMSASFQAKLVSNIETQVTQWGEQAKTDKEIGGEKFAENLAIAKAGMKDSTPELRKLLKESGLGNHPEVIRHFYRLGKLAQQDTTHRGSETKPVAQSFYTNSKMNP